MPPKYLPDLMQMASLFNVISIVNAAPPNSERWIQATRADVSRRLMNTPGENE
ncbi:hypothetical protein [Bradyrhizobium diversitatis]|uniref:Uncharacterized protein n=1 Tax=Bradyrhizobium diversitatis TaxID=2755406 RepID=A0ABS0NZW1_9BRAD|nr:hypothetical protein [Bradyrhizobium diversitatis]MBH5386387.1 hypothetical protein [Bradyrhizobium diversitatis]